MALLEARYRRVPRNLAQLFYEAYTVNKDKHFPQKPLGDFRTDREAPQNIWWYDSDLVDMWKFAEILKEEEAKRKRNGIANLSFGSVSAHRQQRICPTFEEAMCSVQAAALRRPRPP